VDRREVFSSDPDRTTYLRLLQENRKRRSGQHPGLLSTVMARRMPQLFLYPLLDLQAFLGREAQARNLTALSR
jgi:hypothetical protein